MVLLVTMMSDIKQQDSILHSDIGDYVPSDLKGSRPILDSKHIIPTKLDTYNVKLVVCGEYTQVYFYDKKKFKNKKKDKSDLNLTIRENDKVNGEEKKIEDRSIIRSKLECQRVAKANMQDWKTFITLTFAENVTDIDYANKKFSYYVDQVRRVYKDFRYLCIPEFQKRGAVHYHLLTNIDVDSELIPRRPNKKLYNKTDRNYKEIEFYDLKYWNEGFSSAEMMSGDPKKVVGYISKYMTKDIDDRLFGHRRYFYSRNLEIPKESFVDMDDPKHLEFFQKKIQGKEVIYNREYTNNYDGSNVFFREFL